MDLSYGTEYQYAAELLSRGTIPVRARGRVPYGTGILLIHTAVGQSNRLPTWRAEMPVFLQPYYVVR
eukprot:scaffold345101_cov42-Prasinocladus_malaysianus.AAC.1